MQVARSTLNRASRIVGIVGWYALILSIVASGICSWAGGPPQRAGSSSSRESKEPVERPDEFRVTIRRPSGPPLIELKQPDSMGRVGLVACSTCHSIRPPNLENRTPTDLKQFHQGMPMKHGALACYSCHNPDNSDTLRLADGSVVEYADVMNMCAQCHGRQAKAYARGFHGGMTGYWDLSRGGRVRNNCIDCHDPHAPQFPMMQPTFKPRDRFLTPPASDGQLHHDETDHG
jgi:hypothetical protein